MEIGFCCFASLLFHEDVCLSPAEVHPNLTPGEIYVGMLPVLTFGEQNGTVGEETDDDQTIAND
jgi:hypothetical protein